MNTALKFAVLLGVTLSSPMALAQAGRGADYGEGERRSHEGGKSRGQERGSERGGDRERYERPEREAPSAVRGDSVRGGYSGGGRADADPRRLERIAGFDGGDRGGRDAGAPGGYREGYQDGRAHQRIDDRRQHLRQGEVRYSSGHRGRDDWRDDRRDHRRDDRHDYRRDYSRDRHDDWRSPQWRSHWHHGWGGHRYRAPVRYTYPRGYGRLDWRIGFTLPSVFLLDRYYVDHHYYRIAQPPYGCRWLRVDGDLLLVELATGYVVEALYDFFYW